MLSSPALEHSRHIGSHRERRCRGTRFGLGAEILLRTRSAISRSRASHEDPTHVGVAFERFRPVPDAPPRGREEFPLSQAQDGSTVRVHYSVRLSDGSTVDSSSGRDPLEFDVGKGQVIKGVDDAVLGMTAGDKKTVEIPAAEAYGERREDLVAEVPSEHTPDGVEVGNQLQLTQPDGSMVVVTVQKVEEEAVTIDANHPLAGEDLTFDLELVEVSGGGPGIILP